MLPYSPPGGQAKTGPSAKLPAQRRDVTLFYIPPSAISIWVTGPGVMYTLLHNPFIYKLRDPHYCVVRDARAMRSAWGFPAIAPGDTPGPEACPLSLKLYPGRV